MTVDKTHKTVITGTCSNNLHSSPNNAIPFQLRKVQLSEAAYKIRRTLNKAANGLMIRMNIDQSMSLITVLGNGSEHSNHDALVTWLSSNYHLSSSCDLNEPLDQIAKDLYEYLLEKLPNMEASSC